MEGVILVKHTGTSRIVMETAQGSARNSFGDTSQTVFPTITSPSLANITLVHYFYLCIHFQLAIDTSSLELSVHMSIWSGWG
jgi:hypothetical protein